MSQLISLDTALMQLPSAQPSAFPYITQLMTVASNIMETKCNRTFALNTYDELHGPIGPTCSIWVNNPPISDVIAVRTSQFPAIYIQNNDPTSQCQFATVDVSSTGVTLKKMFNNVLVTNMFFDYVTYPTFAQLSAGINALGNQWQATQPNQFLLWQTSDLTTNQSGLSARNISCPLSVYWYYLSGHKVNKDLGEIFVIGGPLPGYQNYRIKYTGGYATIPQEVQQVCAELVQIMYQARHLNFNMSTETLDKYVYQRAVENTFDLLSLGSKLAIGQYMNFRFTRNGVPAQE